MEELLVPNTFKRLTRDLGTFSTQKVNIKIHFRVWWVWPEYFTVLKWHNAFFLFWSNTLTPSADARGWEGVSTVCSCDGSLSRRLTIWKVIKFNKSMQWRQQSLHVEQDFWLFSHDAISPIKYLHFPGKLHKTAGTFVRHTNVFS